MKALVEGVCAWFGGLGRLGRGVGNYDILAGLGWFRWTQWQWLSVAVWSEV